MSADNRSSSSNPFGYTFPAYPANDPPSGPPLLSQNESSALDNFFTDPDHFGGAEALPEQLLNILNTGPDSRVSLPNSDAQWMYSTDHTYSAPYAAQEHSYQQPQSSSNAQPGLAAPEDVLQLVGIPTNGTPADVLHAASTLFMYRANNQVPDQNLASAMFNAPAAHHSVANHTARHASFPFNIPTPTSSSAHHYPSTNGHFRASLDNSMNHSHSYPHSHTSSSHQSSTPMYYFGSDNNFRQTGYAAPREAMEDTTQTHMEFVHGMVHSSNGAMSSVENSVPHTPDLSRGDHKFYPSAVQAFTTLADQISGPESEQSRTKKRRKTKGAEDEDYHGTYATSPVFNHISSPDGDNTVVEDSPENDEDQNLPVTTKRRRASSGAGKSSSLARKNLTEEQKRSNHIRSEQKRRNIIKQGYQDLNDLVPNLKTGGFSKSAVLTETTRFLEEVQAGNSHAEQVLAQLAAKQGLTLDDL